jgi:phage tail-like protein
VRKLVGLRKYTNITLKRGYTQDDTSLWTGTNIHNGVPDRRNVTIILMNEERQPVTLARRERLITRSKGRALRPAQRSRHRIGRVGP